MEKVKVYFYSEKLDVDGKVSLQTMKPASKEACAVDIKSAEDYIIPPNEYVVIRTGLYVSIPEGYCMKVYPRSGMSAKSYLIFKNTVGLIDSDYRGRQIFVMWHNLGDTEVIVYKDDRIAQAMIEKVLPIEYIEVSSIDELKEMGHDRGGGLGSTGQ